MRLTELERAAEDAAGLRDRALRAGGDRWRARGVVHTPPAVARFVLHAVDRALVELGCASGLADPRVAIVDPSCGPGAFLAAALAVGAGRASAPRAFLGIDLDPDAVATARALLAEEADRARFPLDLRCADTLGDLAPFGVALPPDTVIAVVGNPPWASRTGNRHARATAALLEDFRRDHRGEPLAERKIGVLSDDYVRFFRWAAEIARGGAAGGVIGLVTNASFLDGPVHRGMRAALVRWFDGIDVVDLGGSALVARTRDRDENVFGVRPAAAATIAWRRGGISQRAAKVRHAALRGGREEKLARLSSIELDVLRCDPPRFAFARTREVAPVYLTWMSLSDAMPFHREGVQTNRDEICIDADRDRLLDRLRAFARGERRDDLSRAWATLPHYDPERARAAVEAALRADPSGALGISVRPLAYRPLDGRWLAPIPRLCHRPRPRLREAIAHGGPVLLTARKDRGDRPWACFGIARDIPDNCWLSTRSSCRTRAFPPCTPDGKVNLAPQVAGYVGGAISPGAFIAWTIAVLASPRYRSAFDPALRADYPRIPPPADAGELARGCAAGERLIEAFSAPSGGEEVEVGHGRVRSDAIASAVREADAIVSRVLDRASC